MIFFASLGGRRILMACAAFALALGSGYVMQHVLTGDQPSAVVEPLALRIPADPMPFPSDPVQPQSTRLNAPPVLEDRPHPERLTEVRAVPDGLGDPCRAAVALAPEPAAMIHVTAWFPCAPNALARLAHAGLQIEVETDAEGRLTLDLPALESEAAVTVVVENHAVSAVVDVPSAVEFERVALVWDGPQVLSMHAFEFGADRSQTGHVWAGSANRPDRAARGAGGFLTPLGDGTGASAEVYSFPAGLSASQGIVRLLVEAEVTGDICGRMVFAKALQTGPLGLSKTDVELQMPDCSAKGQIVRLQNLLQDMRLAGR